MNIVILLLIPLFAYVSGQEECGTIYNITSFNLTVTDNELFKFIWETDGPLECIDHFVLLIKPTIGGSWGTTYITGRQTVTLAITMQSCVTCLFNISAVTHVAEGNALSQFYTPPGNVTTPPRLNTIVPGTTYINTTWTFDSFANNSCPITDIIVDSPGNFNLSLPVEDTYERLPFPINITDLEPNTLYLTYIYAVNMAGISPPYTILLQTIPEEEND